MPMRLLLLLPAALLLTACGSRVACTGDDANATLSAAFEAEVARLMARDYSNVDTAGRGAAELIAADFAGLRETGRNGDACTGEAVVTVTLDPAVARRLHDPAAAIYMPNELGDTKVIDDTLRAPVEYTVKPGADGAGPAVEAPELSELASAAVVFTMQVVSERQAQSELQESGR